MDFTLTMPFQDLAFMVDSPPEIAVLAVDLHERLIQMPPPLRIPAHVRDPPHVVSRSFAAIRCKKSGFPRGKHVDR